MPGHMVICVFFPLDIVVPPGSVEFLYSYIRDLYTYCYTRDTFVIPRYFGDTVGCPYSSERLCYQPIAYLQIPYHHRDTCATASPSALWIGHHRYFMNIDTLLIRTRVCGGLCIQGDPDSITEGKRRATICLLQLVHHPQH